MIRTTYKGRELKVLKARGSRPNTFRMFVNGKIVHHEWDGGEANALDWFRLIIDRIDAKGPGNNPAYVYPTWYAPGTYALNRGGHVVAPGDGKCICDQCLMFPERNLPALKDAS